MSERISITLSEDLLAELDRLAGSKSSRSALIQCILRTYLHDSRLAKLHARDLARINRAAEGLNREAADVLEYASGKI
jgi:metal-responsive CopG/Arc/MetJ family transcriptional regulator